MRDGAKRRKRKFVYKLTRSAGQNAATRSDKPGRGPHVEVEARRDRSRRPPKAALQTTGLRAIYRRERTGNGTEGSGGHFRPDECTEAAAREKCGQLNTTNKVISGKVSRVYSNLE